MTLRFHFRSSSSSLKDLENGLKELLHSMHWPVTFSENCFMEVKITKFFISVNFLFSLITVINNQFIHFLFA